MTTQAIIFMAASWAFVLGLTAWSFRKLMQDREHFDPDGIGPASPPVPGEVEARERK